MIWNTSRKKNKWEWLLSRIKSSTASEMQRSCIRRIKTG
jgi:hypothetical protein